MSAKRNQMFINKRNILTRGGRLLALVPAEKAPSECGNSSESDDELHDPFSSRSSSPAPSIASSLERMIELSDKENSFEDTTPLTPIINSVCPLSPAVINLENVPILSEIPSINSTTATTPSTSTTTPVTRKRKTRRPKIIPVKLPRGNKKFTLSYKWKKASFSHSAELEPTVADDITLSDEFCALSFFYKFFSPDIITYLVEQTNIYSVGVTGKSISVTEDELKDFLAIHIMMGIVEMPSYTDYWSRKLRFGPIADLMTLKRYQTIRRYLHLVDNNFDDSDRYHKVRPLAERIRMNCLLHETNEKFSVDEMMIPYKGTKAGKRRQYMKDKPNKWGFKNYVRAGVSGMIYDFLLYGGDDTFRYHNFTEEEASVGFGAQVVIALCKSIKKIPAIVCFDNFFSSPELFYILREHYGIFALGTIRNNRLRGAEAILPSEKEIKKKKRGSYAQVVCDKTRLAAVRWNDNKAVTLMSSFVGVEPLLKIKRYCKESKAKVDVDCPKIVSEYNKTMGGVDLADMLIALYKIPFKSRRWYMGIFAQLLDITINNGWIMYRKYCSNLGQSSMGLKEFRLQLIQGLTKCGRNNMDKSKKKQPTEPNPNNEVRFDKYGHDLVIGDVMGRCRLCSKLTTVSCVKCKVKLCFVTGKNPRNCSIHYHDKNYKK